MGGGGGGGGDQQVSTQVILPDWAQQQVQQNIATADQLAQQPYQAYSGPTLAGFTPDQQAAFQAVRANLGSTNPAYGTAIGNVENLPATTQSLLAPYVAKVGGDVTGGISGEAASARAAAAANAPNLDAFGGSKGQAYSDTLASETQRNVSQAMGQIQNQGWNTSSALALGQADAMGKLASAGQQGRLTAASALDQTGTAQQTQQQAQYSNALQQWQQQQNYPYQQLAIQQSALSGTPYGNTVQSSQPYTSNPALQAAGLGIAALPAGASLWNLLNSDAQPAINDYNTGYIQYNPGQVGTVDTGNFDLYNYGAS